MIPRKWMVMLAVLAAATAAFVWQSRQLNQRRASRVALEIQADTLRREVEATRAEMAVLQTAAAEARAQSDALGQRPTAATTTHGSGDDALTKPAIPAKNGATVALNKRSLRQYRIKPVTEDFRVSDAASALLGMNDGERAAVDQAIEELIARHTRLDVAKARPVDQHLTAEPGRKTTFQVPAYPEEGQALMQTLVASLQKAVGSERTELLLHFAELSSLSAEGFDPFGRAEKTITFLDREGTNGQRGDCRIFLQVKSPAATLSTSFANRDDAIPKNWRHLIDQIYPAR